MAGEADGTTGTPRRWDAVTGIGDQEIWDLRRELRGQLVTEVRRRLYASWRRRGAGTAELGWIDGVLDPDVLTIGFARRVPSYKRLTLMLRDRDRLRALLLHPTRPIQIVVAGKAHPADDGGKRLVQELVRFADDAGSATASSSYRTTGWAWRRSSTRAATSGSTIRCVRWRRAARAG